MIVNPSFGGEQKEGSGVGLSMAGQSVEPTEGTTVESGASAEIFNDYRQREYGEDEGYTGTFAKVGNVASGVRSHAEGCVTTATGLNSHAEGYRTTASGSASHAEGGAFTGAEGSKATAYAAHAEGCSTEASGAQSHAEGSSTKATGLNSHAEGLSTKANGPQSHAEGYLCESTGVGSHAEGISSIAEGSDIAQNGCSHAEGYRTKATGQSGAHAEGSDTTASGASSHAEGYYTVAKAPYSHAEGENTIANGWAQTAIGRYNVDQNLTYNTGAAKFIVGKGSSGNERANCFRVSDTGVFATGPHNTTGADYAELFEWLDGNPDKEDRAGRFVTLEGEKIRLAGPGDGFVLGIVSGNPSVVGDVHDDQWAGMYLYDIFGRPLWEDVEVPAVTMEMSDPEAPEKTIHQVIVPAHTEHRQKINPDYDGSQPYQPRTQRPEWDAVGMLGKLVAMDDGTCQVNGWCTVGEGGIATHSNQPTRYRVMARLDESHVRVLIL